MATYYVGIGGNDANNGLSWANRKLTLNGAEDVAVAAGDTVKVGPGTYRELLTIDVSGTSGNPITYIADTTGKDTDGVGGLVRITGSADDIAGTRAQCINCSAQRDYRTFRGFALDGNSGASINLASASCSNWIIEDCWFNSQFGASASQCIAVANGTNNTIRRCVMYASKGQALLFSHTSTVSNAGHLVENCIVLGANTYGIQIDRVGGGTVKNCLFVGCLSAGIRVNTALAAGQTWNVNNSMFLCCLHGLRATATGEITEDYNTFLGNQTADRTSTSTGTHSVTHGVLMQPFMLLNNGRSEPWLPFVLMVESTLRNRAGTSFPTEDLFGVLRAQETECDWGPVEALAPVSKESTTVPSGEDHAYKINGRGYVDIRVPVVASTAFTVSVDVTWDNNANIGSKPQIKLLADYGVSEQTATATGSGGGTFETLQVGGTPNADGVMILRIINRSTHTSAIATYAGKITRA